MKKNLFFIVSIFLSLGFFNHNNAISKKEVLGLIGRGTQTAIGLTAIGASYIGIYALSTAHRAAEGSPSSCVERFLFRLRMAALDFDFNPLVATTIYITLIWFGVEQLYQGVNGLRENIKKIQNNNTKTLRII